MHILILGRNVPSENYPTAGVFEFDQAKALRAAGHSVTYFAVDMRSIRRRRPFGFTSGRQYGIDTFVASLPVGRIPKKFRIILMAKLFDLLHKTAFGKLNGPDVIHSHFLGVTAAATKTRLFRDIPIVATEHSSALMVDTPSSSTRMIAKSSYSKVNALVAVSAALADRIRDLIGIEPIVIPNIVDSEFFFREQERHETFNVLSVGNLRSVKRMQDVIRAFRIAKRAIPNPKLQIIGEGPERGMLEALIQSEGVEADVRLSGMRSREYVAASLTESDVFVLASSRETFGVVLIEAMAAGLPVVATRSGGPDNFLEASGSHIVDVGNVEAIAAKIVSVFREQTAQDRQILAEWTASQFGKTAVVEQLESVYRSVQAKASKASERPI